MRTALVVAALCLCSTLALAQDAAPNAAAVAAKVDELYKRRDDDKVIAEIDKLLQDTLKTSPDDYGLLWRMARLRYWQADGTSGDKKKNLGKEGWDYGERAVKANPAGVEGQYFTGISLGAYSQGAGILKALSEGLEGKFNERVDKSIKLDSGYDLGGPLIAKGRYHYELPWPKRSLEKSAELLKKALEKHPENLRARLYLAETQLKDGDAKTAKETLAPVLSGSVAYDPPEGRRIQALAKGVSKQIEDELK